MLLPITKQDLLNIERRWLFQAHRYELWQVTQTRPAPMHGVGQALCWRPVRRLFLAQKPARSAVFAVHCRPSHPADSLPRDQKWPGLPNLLAESARVENLASWLALLMAAAPRRQITQW